MPDNTPRPATPPPVPPNKPIPRVGPFKSEMMMRDEFAMAALAALVPLYVGNLLATGTAAYRIADAMLEARNANR